MLYGFVATLAKVILTRVQHGDFGWLTIVSALALAAAALTGGYFVQSAYSSGPPDLVIAGLTVVDPIIAVIIGASLLGEGARTPVWALLVWVLAGSIAAVGVVLLAKYHPQVIERKADTLSEPNDEDR